MNAFSRDYVPQIQHKPKKPKRPTTAFAPNNYVGHLGQRTEAEKAKTMRLLKPSGV
jgi:hypothetical protein